MAVASGVAEVVVAGALSDQVALGAQEEVGSVGGLVEDLIGQGARLDIMHTEVGYFTTIGDIAVM